MSVTDTKATAITQAAHVATRELERRYPSIAPELVIIQASRMALDQAARVTVPLTKGDAKQ